MLNTFLNSFNVSFAEGGNIFIYRLKRIPIIGKRIPQSWYKQTNIKLAFGFIQLLLSLFSGFLTKGIYIALVIWLPAIFISEELLNNNVELNEIFLQGFF